VRTYMTRVAALRDDARLGPYRAVCIHLVHAVGLVVVFTLFAFEARVELGAEAHTLAGLHQRDLGPDTQSFANDLVTDAEGEVLVAPAAGDGVHVGGADAAGLDLNLDVVILERFGYDLEAGVNKALRIGLSSG
jgi:hypothetical protein